MIIATITAIMLFFGGGMFSFDVFKDSANKVLKDKDKVKQIKVITKEADKELKILNKSINNESKKLVTLNTNYDMTREELETFLAQQDQYREQFFAAAEPVLEELEKFKSTLLASVAYPGN